MKQSVNNFLFGVSPQFRKMQKDIFSNSSLSFKEYFKIYVLTIQATIRVVIFEK